MKQAFLALLDNIGMSAMPQIVVHEQEIKNMEPATTHKDIELIQTCEACPEQYDAMLNGEQVGYLRLRWGWFTVTCPDVGGKEVYEKRTGHGLAGMFENGAQRKKQLKKARKAIAKWVRVEKGQATDG